jgi:hypothetical protein
LAIAKYLGEMTPAGTLIEVITEFGPYGEGLSGVLVAAFNTGTAHLSTFSNTSERDAEINAAGKSGAPWIVFISSQTSGAAAFLIAANTLPDYATKNMFLTDSAANTDLLVSAKGASAVFPRVHGSRPSVPQGPVYEQFRASFNAAFKVEANSFSYVAHTYDAAWLSFYGIAWSLIQERAIYGTGIARGLRHVSSGSKFDILPASWNGALDEFHKGNGVDVTGASGTLDYGPANEETTGATDIWKISTNGASIVVEKTITP